MYIKSVDVVTKDIFLGNKGWDNWTRYSFVDGKWVQTKGLRVDAKVHSVIVDKITTWNENHKTVRKPHGNSGQVHRT